MNQPIESIMTTTMENIRDMVDVNTVIGDPVATPEGATVIPVSRVSFGFLAGGGEFPTGAKAAESDSPFAGGSGAGVSVQPMGFLYIDREQARLLPAQYYAPVDRIIEMAPKVLSDLIRVFQKDGNMPSRS